MPPVKVGLADRKQADATLQVLAPTTEVTVSASEESTPVKVYYATERTLYGSHKDLAMWVSKHANSEYPVGHFPPTSPLKGRGMVDVSQLHMNIVGHDYFITTRPVLEDGRTAALRKCSPAKRV